MIVVAGLTPAWQTILRFTKLEVGEVNRAAEVLRCGSGKVLNVGLALAALGVDARTISPLAGPAREPIVGEFDDLEVAVDWIDTIAPTRVCTTLLDDATGATTELVENAGPITALELRAYRDAYETAAARAKVAVFTGSLPAGVAPSFYRELADVTPGRIVVDARGPELLQLFEAKNKPFLVKPNREELGKTVGRDIATDDDLRDGLRLLHERGAAWVVVSQGKDALWASSVDEGLWRLTPPRAERVVNPIGCGDCLCAGIAAELAAGREVLPAVAYGMAAAADNLRSLLPARLDKATVARVAASIIPERL